MVQRGRLDAELVRRGIARSRGEAVDLIRAGRIAVRGLAADKPATVVDADASIAILGDAGPGWVSRGAHKLIGALDRFTGIEVFGRRCLDAGASTGGFTDVLLHRGARQVYAVDVGYGQLAWRLRQDPRVLTMERRHVRDLTAGDLGGAVDLTVADLSFISLRSVMSSLAEVTAPSGDLALLCKPQFEVGRESLGNGGVVRDPALWAGAIMGVVDSAATAGLGTVDIVASQLPGPAGNVEFFLWLRHLTAVGSDAGRQRASQLAESAIAAAPGDRRD